VVPEDFVPPSGIQHVRPMFFVEPRSIFQLRLVDIKNKVLLVLVNSESGPVDEIMIDIASGKVAYAVLSFGGFLGMGSKLFALPCSEGLSGCVLHGIAGQCACSEHATIALVRVGFSNLNLLFHGIS